VEEAIAVLRSVVGPEGSPEEPLVRNAAALERLSILLGQRQAHAEAEVYCRRLLAHNLALANKNPTSAVHQEQLADTYQVLGSLVLPPTESKRRVEAVLAAKAIQQRLVDRYPDVPGYRADLARSYMNLGILLIDASDRPEGMDCHAAARRGAELFQELAAEFPANVEYRETAADAWMNVANIYRPHDLFQIRLREVLLRKGLRDQFPHREDYQEALRNCCGCMAFELVTHASANLAEQAVVIDQATHKGWDEKDPLTWDVRGAARCAAGNWQGTIEAFHRQRELSESTHRLAPFALARSHHHLGNAAEARRLYEQGVEWVTRHAPNDGTYTLLRSQVAALLGLDKDTKK
jgi:tetratricopeptide (TPR) repeat protein